MKQLGILKTNKNNVGYIMDLLKRSCIMNEKEAQAAVDKFMAMEKKEGTGEIVVSLLPGLPGQSILLSFVYDDMGC